jgi:outer membrane protein
MKAIIGNIIIIILLVNLPASQSLAQENSSAWTLEKCISYALEKNVQVQKSGLTNDRNQLNADQAKLNRLPSLSASARQNFNWSKNLDPNTLEYTSSLYGSNSTSFSANSSVSIFNGLKTANKIKQAELDLESGKYNSEAIKESVSLSILNAFLQVLYNQEQVANAQKQIEATTEQLALAGERLNLSVISQSDYLQIKSELATEKQTLANYQSQLSTAKVNLMQLMELPVDNNFTIVSPDIQNILNQNIQPNAQEIYNAALGFKPQIKTAELNKQSALLDEKIARADLMPSLSMDAGISTGYSKVKNSYNYDYSSQGNTFNFGEQLNNKISPSVGISMSIPIFQKKQVKTNVELARIGLADAELDEINTRNELRKNIEQACQDVVSVQTEYAAGQEQLDAQQESYQVSTEKFKLGLLNSVDYLFEKTNLITSESKFLQSKYTLIFNYKILDFYKGTPLSL